MIIGIFLLMISIGILMIIAQANSPITDPTSMAIGAALFVLGLAGSVGYGLAGLLGLI